MVDNSLVSAGPTCRTTGVGSLPGTDPSEAARLVAGEFDVPHVPELPARGPGADMIGRALSLISSATGEFSGVTTPTGWRLAGGRTGAAPGREMRRAKSWLGEDLDLFEEALLGYSGLVKVQIAGPWTIASLVESTSGMPLLADRGACRELAGALSEAVADHKSEIARRVPDATVIVQLDEPGLPTVMGGGVRSASGRARLRIPEIPEIVDVLARPIGAARDAGRGGAILHCCACEVPFEVASRAGFDGIAIDLGALAESADEALGAWWDRGGFIVLGVVPSLEPSPSLPLDKLADSVTREVEALWARIGWSANEVGDRTWLSTGCGLAGSSPEWARSVGSLLRRSGRRLAGS